MGDEYYDRLFSVSHSIARSPVSSTGRYTSSRDPSRGADYQYLCCRAKPPCSEWVRNRQVQYRRIESGYHLSKKHWISLYDSDNVMPEAKAANHKGRTCFADMNRVGLKDGD